MNKLALIILAITLVTYGCTTTNIAGSVVSDNIEISTPEIVCKDSDGGDMVDIQGTVTIEIKGNIWKNYTDECINAESVMEYYCEGDSYKTKKYYCDNACINGMCR